MKPDNKKVVTAEFRRLLEQRSLAFRPIKAGLPHRSTFEKVLSDDLTLYILLTWHSYKEEFGIEVGWVFKQTLDDVGSQFDARNALGKDAAIIDLASIASQEAQFSWNVRANASASLPVVHDAFAELLRLGMPYLEQVIRTKLPTTGAEGE